MNNIEREVVQILQRRRAGQQERAMQNLFYARSNQHFEKNEIAIRTTEFEISRATGAQKEKLQKQLKNLKAERSTILKDINLAEEDLAPKPICKTCGDTGFVNGQRCKCFKNLVILKLLQNSGIEPKELANINDFKTNIGDEKQQKDLAAYKKFLIEFADKFPAQKTKTLTVCGTPGAGKTFGAKCLMREVLRKGEPALFLSAFDLSSLFLKYHTAFVQDKNSIFESILEPELLVIDDLGTEPILKNVTKEYLYVLITERQDKGKTTFITTNLGPDHILERYGERVFSRLTDKSKTKLIMLSGKDIRHQN